MKQDTDTNKSQQWGVSSSTQKALLRDLKERGGILKTNLEKLCEGNPEEYGYKKVGNRRRQVRNLVNEWKIHPDRYERNQLASLGEVFESASSIEAARIAGSSLPTTYPSKTPSQMSTIEKMVPVDTDHPENHGGQFMIFKFTDHEYIQDLNAKNVKKLLCDGFNLVTFADMRWYRKGIYKMTLVDECTIEAEYPSMPYDFVHEYETQEKVANILGSPVKVAKAQITARGIIAMKPDRHVKRIKFTMPPGVRITKKIFDSNDKQDLGLIPSIPMPYSGQYVRIDWYVSIVEEAERLADNFKEEVKKELTDEEKLELALKVVQGMSLR